MSILKAKLDPELLNAFTEGFYGYGNYKSDTWFVGIEEGGGGSYEKIVEHLQCWKERGGHELEDLRKFHEQKGVTKWFEHKPRLQRTWKGLLRILMSSQGRSTDNKALREAQANELGRTNGDNCLLELMPLPAPGTRMWPYADLVDDPELRNHLTNRKTYGKWASEFRVPHLQQALRNNRPKVVLFYGRAPFDQECWESIAKVSFRTALENLLVGHDQDRGTHFLITPHMAARGLKNSYLDDVGQFIRRHCNVSTGNVS